MEQEKVLWQQFQRGDQSAFYTLYDRYFPVLFRYCRQITADKPLIEDVIHDLFLELWDSRERLARTRSVKAYLLSSVRRKVMYHLRRPAPQILSDTLSTPSFTLLIDSQVTDSLAAALKSLPPSQREILYLKFYQDLSYQEIADSLGMKVDTVYKTVRRALLKLKKHPLLITSIAMLLTIFLFLLS